VSASAPLTFDELYERSARELSHYLRARGAGDDADDLTHEVFIAAWRHWPRMSQDGERQQIASLYFIANRKLIDRWRSPSRDASDISDAPDLQDSSADVDPEAVALSREALRAVFDMGARWTRDPERTRQTMALVAAGFPLNVIGKQQGRTIGAVRADMRGALKRYGQQQEAWNA
jgi:DNA-directed RNA polymerase specialized sigma24 family protein